MAKGTESGAGARERLLKVRSELRKRTPRFIRAETHKRKRVKGGWRYPRGLHLKMGEQKRGARKRVEPGFRAPALVRGLSPSGYEPVLVHRPEEIAAMDSRSQAAILSATLGGRKKVEAVRAALEGNIAILNLKDPEAFLDGVRERFAKKKAAAEKEKAAKEKKAKSIEAVVEKEAKPASTEEKPEQKKQQKEKPAKEMSAEEKAKQEQKERDKLLTKKS